MSVYRTSKKLGRLADMCTGLKTQCATSGPQKIARLEMTLREFAPRTSARVRRLRDESLLPIDARMRAKVSASGFMKISIS